MPDAASFLTRKVGPLPIWTYGVAAAALVALIALYRRGQSTLGAQQPIPASPFASSDQGLLNYPPTVVVTPSGVTSSNPSVTQPSGATTSPALTYRTLSEHAVPFYDLQGGTHGSIPPNQPLTPLGGPVQGTWQGRPNLYYPFSYNGSYVLLGPTDFTTQGGGGGGDAGGDSGGGRAVRSPAGTIATHHVTGQRWDHFVPFQPQQFVDGRGGGAGGGHPIAAIARRTGIPEARLRSLNYHLRRGDGSYRHGIIRVA